MQRREFHASQAEVEEAISTSLGRRGRPGPLGFEFRIGAEGAWSLAEQFTGTGTYSDKATVMVTEIGPDRASVSIDVTSPARKQFLGLVDLGNNKEEAEAAFLDHLATILADR